MFLMCSNSENARVAINSTAYNWTGDGYYEQSAECKYEMIILVF
jgi:hypothetical protein